MAVPVLNFPHRQMPRPPAVSGEVGIGSVPTWQLWRSSPANAFGAPEQAELKDLLGRVRPLRVEHWDAALAGDAAAAVALALRMAMTYAPVRERRVHEDQKCTFGAYVQSESTFTVNRQQILAARAWLELSQQELADLTRVSKRTISHLEAGDRIPHGRTLRDIQTVLEALGVEFIVEGGVGTGIRVVKKPDR